MILCSRWLFQNTQVLSLMKTVSYLSHVIFRFAGEVSCHSIVKKLAERHLFTLFSEGLLFTYVVLSYASRTSFKIKCITVKFPQYNRHNVIEFQLKKLELISSNVEQNSWYCLFSLVVKFFHEYDVLLSCNLWTCHVMQAELRVIH
jgi:hypothetical protein